jgi:hypothetical protein
MVPGVYPTLLTLLPPSVPLRRINPFIKLDRRRIAFAATAAAGGARGQLAKVALADPFAEHAAQRFGIDVEMIGQIDQRDAALFLDVIAQVRQDQWRTPS